MPDFKVRKKHSGELTPQERVKAAGREFSHHGTTRARVDAIVEDPVTAAALKPYYPYGCKRPTFHDEYLPTFNLPHVHLVDTAPRGVSEINARGVVHDGTEYPVDVLIYATGFEWMATSTNMIVGRQGRTLRDKWQQEGTKTFWVCTAKGSLTRLSSPGRRAVAAALISPTPLRSTVIMWSGCSVRCATKASMLSTSSRNQKRNMLPTVGRLMS